MSNLLFIIVLWPGTTYLRAHDHIEAYRYLMLQSAVDPSYESYYQAGICALAEGKTDTSFLLLNLAHPQQRFLYYYLGVVYYQKQFIEPSNDFFTRVIDEDPYLWQAQYYVGLINLKQNRVDKATEFLSTTPDTTDRTLIVSYIEDFNRLAAAREQYQMGDYAGAIATYENVEFYYGYREIGLAHAYAKLQEYGQSLSLLDEVIHNISEEELVSHSLYLAAQVCLITGEVKRVREYLREFLARKASPEAQFLLGKTYSDEIKHDSALVYFKSLPDSVDEYLFHKARSEYFLGLWGRAEEKLLRHREQFPGSLYGDRATFILASINYKRKEYRHAIDFFSELVAVYPASIYAANSQRSIGSAYYELGDYTSALDAYQKVKDLKPSRIVEEGTTLLIYETLYRMGRYISLVDALRNYIEKNPSSRLVPKTRMRIAKILLKQKEYYQSMGELNRLTEAYPHLSIAHEASLEKARIQGLLGNEQEKKNILHTLLANEAAETYHSYVANELANIYVTIADYDSSLHYYNILLEDADYREKAIFEIARIYDLLGQYSESGIVINKLIAEYPSSVFLFDAYLLKTRVYKNDGEYDKAEILLDELLDKLGKRPEIYMELGHLYFEIEKYVLAHDNYLLAGELYKQNRDDAAQALLHAGEASVAIGDLTRAREHFLQAQLIAESIALKDKATAMLSKISED